MKKTILILGATGKVGFDLTSYLSKKYYVIALSRNKKKLNIFKKNNIKIINHNLKKKLNVPFKIDYIINCIVTHSFSKNQKLEDYVNSNILSSLNMVYLSNLKKVKLIINLSSISVYGKPKEKIISEKSSLIKPDLLGASKLFIEESLKLQKNNFINLRLPGVLCNDFDYQRPWLNTLIYKIKNNYNFSVYDANYNFNNFISTYEIYKFIDFLIFNKIIVRDTFNFSASKPIKLIKIIDKIKFFYNSVSKIKNKNIKNSFVISNRKLFNQLKYEADTSLNIINDFLKKNK